MEIIDGFPRRNRLDLNTPAELAIYNAMGEVEKCGASVMLTKAVTLLQEAKDALADHIEQDKEQVLTNVNNHSYCTCIDPDREAGYSYCMKCHKHVSDQRMELLLGEQEDKEQEIDENIYVKPPKGKTTHKGTLKPIKEDINKQVIGFDVLKHNSDNSLNNLIKEPEYSEEQAELISKAHELAKKKSGNKDQLGQSIESIKLKWQKHNRDNGMSWNEVAELVNEVAGIKDIPSSMGDYKCHVETTVKDSKGNPVFVDKCLKEAIEYLNANGFKTIASCCGHGKVEPSIIIQSKEQEIKKKPIEDRSHLITINDGMDDDYEPNGDFKKFSVLEQSETITSVNTVPIEQDKEHSEKLYKHNIGSTTNFTTESEQQLKGAEEINSNVRRILSDWYRRDDYDTDQAISDIHYQLEQYHKSQIRKELIKAFDWLTKEDSPYAICYGDQHTRFATTDNDYSIESVVDKYLNK